jgi:2-hydroxychromene-2-carboxylate isomerase
VWASGRHYVRVHTIRELTDPGSPRAFAAEPVRWRLSWRHELAWETRMAVTEPPSHAELERAARESGMPIEPRPRFLGGPSIHACRVAVGARLRWPDRADAMLRRLRVLVMAGEPIDDSDTFEIAAGQAGLPVGELAAYCAEPEVEEALQADLALARGRPVPSYEVDGIRVSDLSTALTGLESRPDPGSVEAVLAWAGTPLATAEVAAVCGRDDVRDELARVARFQPVAGDGYWSLP